MINMLAMLACPPCFIRREDSCSHNRCNRVQLARPFGMRADFLYVETYSTEIVQTKNPILRGVEFFSN